MNRNLDRAAAVFPYKVTQPLSCTAEAFRQGVWLVFHKKESCAFNCKLCSLERYFARFAWRRDLMRDTSCASQSDVTSAEENAMEP
ncbi:hypothetical protein EYF80_008540 [Liparis tanakae]|uniref:Uncharacterized protein n=1 Tax=Liparis tanakae TaxID=230148 RepID=A0A4Z2ITN3_9TELE|nr:hypothetical protein EYF80_008540 [Liparis tanakae]